MRTSWAIGIAAVAFVSGFILSYLLFNQGYEQLHLIQNTVLVDKKSNNQISLPAGTILVRGGRIPWAPDDTYTSFLPVYLPSDKVIIKKPIISHDTYYSVPSASNSSK